MPAITQWEREIGRRLRLRDLYVFFTVIESGSMAKAASSLGVSTPSTSDVIADLEHALGVRLLDRGPKGVVPTSYGVALLARGRAAFDELRQGIREIQFIADPGAGDVYIGCSESIAAEFLVAIIDRISSQPRMRLHVQQVRTPNVEFPELEERKVDFVLARLAKYPLEGALERHLRAEVLFDDMFRVVVGKNSRWGRARKVVLEDLIDEPWILPPMDALAGVIVTHAFESAGLKPPRLSIATFSIHLRSSLVGTGRFVTALPRSILQLSADRHLLKKLPIALPDRPSPAVVTLKNRTLGPTAREALDPPVAQGVCLLARAIIHMPARQG